MLQSYLIPIKMLILTKPLLPFSISPISSFCMLKDLHMSTPKGKLSIVATPIGNLSDLTPNILKCLFKADLIGCEDRRVAGQLYTLIKSRNVVQKVEDKFGTLGLTNLVVSQDKDKEERGTDENQRNYQFYEYSNMNDKQRRKFLSKLSLQQQQKFKLDYLKYRAKKIVSKNQQFLYKTKHDKFDQLYGIEVSDYKHIELQIMSTRAKKGRGVLIPLNTYSETKMYDLVRNMLESKNVVVVSDAGMPCISDPGWKIVRMIRESMPTVPIQVIGGPSALDIMLTLARGVVSHGQSVSGRFEGFASPEISNMTQESITYNRYLQEAKQKDFSIHFINSKKMKKAAYELVKIYGQDHKIIIANQMTKKFEKKFHGSLKQLLEHISRDEKEFQGIGQMSYILYSDKNKPVQKIEKSKQKSQQQEQQQEQIDDRIVSLNVNTFVKALEQTSLKSKQKADLVSSVFGLKGNQAKNIVYANLKKIEKNKAQTQ